MEEQSYDSTLAESNISPRNIRLIESNLQTQLRDFERDFSGTALNTSTFCEVVKDQILNFKDEPHLSKNQNNYRRIHIASELVPEICLFHGYNVEFELTKIISNLLHSEKYQKLSRKITQKANLDLRAEKYFNEEAQSKMLTSKEADKNVERQATSRRSMQERNAEPETDKTLKDAGSLERGTRDLFGNYVHGDTIGNITEIRAETTMEASIPEIHSPRLPDVTYRAAAEPEISLRQSTVHPQTEENINEILHVLEEQILAEGLDSVLGAVDKPFEETRTVVEETTLGNGTTEKTLQVSDEWSLPSTESVEPRRKKQPRLIIDPVTTIRNYAARALELNSQIQIERLEVYEGPPRILKALTVEHLMTTPGFRASLFQGGRSCSLNGMYQRHLISAKKPPETLTFPERRQATEARREANTSKAQPIAEIVEESGVRAGFHSLPQRSVLADVPEKTLPLDLANFTAVEVPNRESLIGISMSRIMTPNIQPPDEERINDPHPLRSPRLRNLHGKSLQSDSTPPWKYTPQGNPPSEKWKKFKFVIGRLQEYWSMCQIHGTQKTLSLREFVSLGDGSDTTDYLTVLRIVDKLSIQRKLLLQYTNGDVIIKPFEVPYASEKQFSLAAKEIVF